MGIEPVGNTPAEFAAQIRADLARWQQVVEDAGMLTADAYVLALGAYSPLLARGAGAVQVSTSTFGNVPLLPNTPCSLVAACITRSRWRGR